MIGHSNSPDNYSKEYHEHCEEQYEKAIDAAMESLDNRPKGYLVWSLYTNGMTHLRGVYTEEKKGRAYQAAVDTKHEAQTVRSWVEEIELNSFFCELPKRPESRP